MDEEAKTVVETSVPEQAKPASAPPPAVEAAPPERATPPQQPAEDFEKRLKDREREWQARKDRELAAVHKQYQERLRQTVGKAAQTLQEHGVKDTSAVERAMVDDMELEEYRAWKQQAAAQTATFDYGAGIIRDIAARYEVEIDTNDPALWQAAETWEAFTERVRKVASDKVKAAREAARLAEEEAKRKQADRRLDSGQLDTLNVTPAGVVVADELAKFSPKDAGTLYEIGAERVRKERSGKGR